MKRSEPAADSTCGVGLPPLGIYAHVPFCERKCHYCDFNSGVYGPGVRQRYVNALIREIRASVSGSRPVKSIFIGGGTPSVLPAPSLEAILTALRSRFTVLPDVEITVECNPGTVAAERMSGETTLSFLRGLRSAGVNRLSFGVQSLDAGLLQTLGRIHTPDQALRSIEAAREAGFENINVDLMFGLPAQTSDQWAGTLAGIIALDVPHISAYSLIVEPGTRFAEWDAAGRLARCEEADEASLYETTIEALISAGYEHYEVSAFAKPGHRCVQNTIYWHNEEYVGFGNGATSYVDGERYSREPGLESYVRLAETGKDTISARERLGELGTMGETMMMGLRLLDGVEVDGFARRFGRTPLSVYADEIDRLTRAGLLQVTPDAVRLTHRGLFLANEVWEAFV